MRMRDGDFAFFLPARRRSDPRARLQPFDRQLEIRICKAGPGTAHPRALVIFVVGPPGRCNYLVDCWRELVKVRIVETLAYALGELVLGELHARHSLADLDTSHGAILTPC